jgi:alkylation response protein AidB-like acyl-CoA dehydrogenase
MMTEIEPRPSTTTTAPVGGAFLVAPVVTGSVFTPERLSPQHLAIRESIGEFVAREVEPRRERLEARDYATHRELMAILGHDGYVGIEVPEAYGGAGLDHVTAVVVIEALSPADALAVTYAAHSGIGTLPTVFFGTDEQKRRYLPGLVAGTTIAAYALTEPGTGSDAQAIRTRAVRQTDGSYRLDGAKQFITNAGFADLFTVYARVEDGAGDGGPQGIAAFLVERETPGLEVGAEEHKMGIHGTSTCPLTFDGLIIPAENLLGTIGEGHKIAFNVLNVGRFKLAAAALGGMRPAVRTALEYAQGRVAFDRPIFRFPLVAGKVAGMAVRTYAVESMVYRIAGLMDGRLDGVETGGSPEAVRAALEEYAVECSIAKVAASEDLGWVVDELVQIHGGYGYIEGYPAARAYRDARINRIWEGTNEINRLLVPGTLIRRAMKGRVDLLGSARRAQEALLAPSPAAFEGAFDDPLGPETALVDGLRQVALILAGGAVQRYGTALEEEQEVLAGLADLAIALFITESALVRARQARGETDATAASRHLDLARLVVLERVGPAELTARSLAARIADGDEARMLQSAIRRLMRGEPVDRVAIARRVAAAVEAAGGYPV